MNLLRHPAWGRAQECYGEDPVLTGQMGAGLTRGLRRNVMACVKHFALNSIEDSRFKVDVVVDAHALHEVYLPHFKTIVEGPSPTTMTTASASDADRPPAARSFPSQWMTSTAGNASRRPCSGETVDGGCTSEEPWSPVLG